MKECSGVAFEVIINQKHPAPVCCMQGFAVFSVISL